jgi:protein gp37
MAIRTSIEWTQATWNPTVGCSLASPGCTNCYAMGEAHWLGANSGPTGKYSGLTCVVKGRAVWNNEVRLVDKALGEPFRWSEPTLVFVNSMSDVFHPKLTDVEIARVWAVMAATPQHRYQVLTKRADRMLDWLSNPDVPRLVAAEMCQRDMFATIDVWPLPNVWIGVSVEDQARANERIPVLLQCPAAIRFLSMEPLLEHVSITAALAVRPDGSAPALAGAGLHWVIVGGESGEEARPLHPDWARSLRDECRLAAVRFFFKQVGEWAWTASPKPGFRKSAILSDGKIVPPGTPRAQLLSKVGKFAAGNLLDGETIQQMPTTA